MLIYLGNTKINPQGIAKVFIGSDLVFENESNHLLQSNNETQPDALNNSAQEEE